VYMHGKRDTYNMRKANQFIRTNVGKTKEDKDSECNYKGMLAFWKGLNRFRLSEVGTVFRNAEAIPPNYYAWITPANPAQLGYCVDNKVLVLINADDCFQKFYNITFPEGQWKLIGNNREIDPEKGIKDEHEFVTVEGKKTYVFNLEKTSFKVWIRI